MTLSQNEATRFISVIDYRIGKALGRGTVLEITYGDVDIVTGREVSVFIGGDTNPSDGFRVPSGLHVVAGDRVRVAIDPRGYRYVEEVLAPTSYAKAAIDPVRGYILFGDGTVAPSDGIYRVSAGVLGTDADLTAGAISGSSLVVSGLIESTTLDVSGSAQASALFVDGDASVGSLTTDFVDIELASGVGLSIRITGDADPRLAIQEDGALEWGDGSGAADVNLYRSTTNLLKTDDEFEVGANGGKDTLRLTSTGTDTGITLGGDVNLYRSAANVLKTDDALQAASLAIGANKVARYVAIGSTPINTTRTSDLAATDVELTALPSTGVVAVTGYITCSSSTTGNDTVTVYHYDGTQAGIAQATGVVNRDGVCGFTAVTGGANNRTIKYGVNWGSGTVSYQLVITGYWTTE